MVSTGDVLWTQAEDSAQLEFEAALVLPEGAKPKDLTVAVKEEEVVVVKYQDSVLLQWRLSASVESEANWSVADGKITVELTKKKPEPWQQLVAWPVSPNDRIMLNEAEIDALIASELPPLPAKKRKMSVEAAEGQIATDGPVAPEPQEEQDLDRLLEEAEAELHPMVQQELKNGDEEASEIEERRTEFVLELDSAADEEKRLELERKIAIVDRMRKLNEEIRTLRSQPMTLKTFLAIQSLDVKKGRCNAGDMSDAETELFGDDDEAAIPGATLTREALTLLQGDGPTFKKGLHYLRLAAIHHESATAAVLLFRIYNELHNPAKATYFLLQRALAEDCDPLTNSLCAELHEKGVRMFPPLMGMVVYYHQRAAQSGSTNSMMSLANIFQRGCASNTISDEKTQLSNVDLTRFRGWLKYAEDRASPSAFFALCHLHMGGELEFGRDYHKAKAYLKRAVAAMPDLKKVMPQMEAKLEALRRSEGIEQQPSPKGSPTTAGTAKPASPIDGPKGTLVSVAPKAAAPARQGRPDASAKLSLLSQSAGGANAKAMMEAPSSKGDSDRKSKGQSQRRFWERTVSIGVAVYSVWTLAFPVRVMLLPHFYMAVQILKDTFLRRLLAPSATSRGGLASRGLL